MATKENKLLKVEINRLKGLLKSLPNKHTRKNSSYNKKIRKNKTPSNKSNVLERKIDNLDNKLTLITRQLAVALRELIPAAPDDVYADPNSDSIDSRATDDLI